MVLNATTQSYCSIIMIIHLDLVGYRTFIPSAAYTTAGQRGWYTSGNDERTEGAFKWTDNGYPYRYTCINTVLLKSEIRLK